MDIPARLTMDEIEALSGLTRRTLYTRTRNNLFPKKLYTSRTIGAVYNGFAVYEALGYIQGEHCNGFGQV